MMRISILIIFLLGFPGGAVGQQGSLVSWGSDSGGQVSFTPSGKDFLHVAAGGAYSVALKSDGSLVAWGDDSYGRVSGIPGGNDFVQVAAGDRHGIALKADGSLVSWGDDSYGKVSGTPSGIGFVQVAAGWNQSLVLMADGSLQSWGRDLWNLVSGTPTGTDFIQVSCGKDHSAALRADGSILSWGRDDDQQVTGTPAGSGFLRMDCGSNHSVALRSDGSLVSWGADWNGEVSNTPTGTDFTQVVGGGGMSYALKLDQSIVGWGTDIYGVVSTIPLGNHYLDIAAGGTHGIALSDTPGVPVLSVPRLIERATAEIKVTTCSPGDLVAVGASLTGPGPHSSAYGVIELSPPLVYLSQAVADSSGITTFTPVVPGGAGGLPIWFHAVNLTNGLISNSLMENVGENNVPTIRQVIPDEGEQDSLVAFLVLGTNFTSGCQIECFDSSFTFSATEEWFGHEKIIGGKLDLTGVPIGFYSVRVVSSTGLVGELPNAFEVIPSVP